MAQVNVTETIDADIEAVWAALGDFGGIQAGGPIERVEVEGQGVGMVRHIHMGGGVVSERLDAHDGGAHTFAYVILNDDSPLPFRDYSAKVVLTAQDGATKVDWSGTFEPRGVPEEKAVEIARGIYSGAIAGARKALT
jgi:carbon monoxide dehydrogenase subunit G